jgi:glycerol 3-phosphatase-2
VRPAEADDVLVLAAAANDGDDRGDGLDGLRALCVAHWSRHPAEGAGTRVVAAGDRAARALDAWGLVEGDGPEST